MSWGTSVSTLQGSNIPSLNRSRDILEFYHVRQLDGGQMPVASFPEASGQTFVAGQWVYLDDSGGQLNEATDGIAAVIGVALKDASGVQATEIPVILATATTVFRGDSTTPANVATTQVGDYVDLDVNAGVHTIDENDSTDSLFRVVRLPTGATDSTHENYGKLEIVVASSQLGQIAEATI